jgi:hypothetical protein
VQRGHVTEPPPFTVVLDPFASRGVLGPSWATAGLAGALSRLDAAAIAAFSIVVKGGLIPHARQGGIGVALVAVEASKLEGTGLENEHIGQTHVAFTGLGGGGVVACERGDCVPANCVLKGSGLAPELRDRSAFFRGLGYMMIFAEDLRKPAWYSARSISFRSMPTEYFRGSSTAT